MPNQKVSELSIATPVDGDKIYISQTAAGPTDRAVLLSALKAYIASSIGVGPGTESYMAVFNTAGDNVEDGDMVNELGNSFYLDTPTAGLYFGVNFGDATYSGGNFLEVGLDWGSFQFGDEGSGAGFFETQAYGSGSFILLQAIKRSADSATNDHNITLESTAIVHEARVGARVGDLLVTMNSFTEASAEYPVVLVSPAFARTINAGDEMGVFGATIDPNASGTDNVVNAGIKFRILDDPSGSYTGSAPVLISTPVGTTTPVEAQLPHSLSPSTGVMAIAASGVCYWRPIAEYDAGNSGASKTIDWLANGLTQKVTMTADCGLTFTAPLPGETIVFKMIQDGTGGWDPTWPGSVEWGAAGEPAWDTAAGKVNIAVAIYDGTSYWAKALTIGG